MSVNQDVAIKLYARDYSQKTFKDLVKVYESLIKVQQQQAEASQKGEGSASALTNTFDRLKDVGTQLLKLKALTETYQAQASALDVLSKSAAEARDRYQKLKTEYEGLETATGRQTRALASANKAVEKSTAREEKKREALAKTASELRKYGVDTASLTSTQERLVTGVNQVNTALAKQDSILDGLSANKAAAKVQMMDRDQAHAEAIAIDKIINALQRQADQALATSRGYRTLGRVVNTTTATYGALGKSIQTIIAPAESARNTLGGLEKQINDTAKNTDKLGQDVRQAKESLRQLGEAQKSLAGMASLIDQFRQQNQLIRQSRNEYNAARAELRTLSAQVRQSGADHAALGIQIQQAQQRLQAATTALRSQSEAARRSQTALRAAGVDTRNLTEAQNRLIQSANQSVSAVDRLSGAVRRSGQAKQQAAKWTEYFTNGQRQSLSMLERVRGELIALTTAYVGLQGAINLAGGAVDMFKTRERAMIRAEVYAPGASQQEWEYIIGLADALSIRLSTLADTYSKFATSAVQTGLSVQEARYIFEAVGKAGRVMQLGDEDMKGVFRALEQMLSKGQVYAEELRQQLGERLPAAVAQFAKGMGVPIDQFLKMMEQGQVTAKEVLNFARSLNESVADQMDRATEGVLAAEARLATAQDKFRLAIADAGFIDAYTDMLTKLTEFLSSDKGVTLAENLAKAFTAMAEAIIWAADNSEQLVSVLGTLVAIKVGIWVGSMVVGLVRSAKALKDLVLGMKGAASVFGAKAAATGRATSALGGLSRALRLLMRLIPGVGAVLIAWDIGEILYNQSETARKAIDSFAATLKTIPTFIEAALKTIPALLQDLTFGPLSVIEDALRDAINFLVSGLEDLARKVPVIGNRIGDALRESLSVAPGSQRGLFKETADVWREAFEEIDQIKDTAIKRNWEQNEQIVKQAVDFARKMKAATGMGLPLMDRGPAPIVPGTGPLAPAGTGFQFTEDPGTAPTPRSRQIAELTKEFEKLQKAADKANKTVRENLARRDLPGRLALVDEEFAPMFEKARGVGGAEGAELIKQLEKIVALRKENERIEFEGLDVDKRVRQIKQLADAYDKLKAEIAVGESKVDPSMGFDERLAANIDKVEASYSKLLRTAQQVGGSEGANFSKKLEQLKAENIELVTQQTRLAEIKRLEDDISQQVSIKSNLEKEIQARRQQGMITEKQALEELTRLDEERNIQLMASITALEQFVQSMGTALSPEQIALINAEIANLKLGLDNARASTEDFIIAQGILDGMQTSLNSVVTELTRAAIGVQSIGDAFKNIGATVAKFFADFLMKIAQAIMQQMILNALAGAGWGGVSTAAKSMIPAAGGGAMHNGGIVGDKSSGSGFQSRSVSPSWFAGARRYHTGGFPGLRPDEVPTILQKGEQVLSKDDPDNALNGGRGMTGGGSAPDAYRFVLVDDRASVPEAMNSSEGEKVIMQFLRRNRASVKSILG